MRCAVPATSMPVGRGGEGHARRPRRLGVAGVDDHGRQLAQPGSRSSASSPSTSAASTSPRSSSAAALSSPGFARGWPRAKLTAAGKPGLPGEHVLGAARVAVAAQRQRDRVPVAAEVAHEREQRERLELVERAVQEGDVARLRARRSPRASSGTSPARSRRAARP